jgi:hypothetical protein
MNNQIIINEALLHAITDEPTDGLFIFAIKKTDGTLLGYRKNTFGDLTPEISLAKRYWGDVEKQLDIVRKSTYWAFGTEKSSLENTRKLIFEDFYKGLTKDDIIIEVVYL